MADTLSKGPKWNMEVNIWWGQKYIKSKILAISDHYNLTIHREPFSDTTMKFSVHNF